MASKAARRRKREQRRLRADEQAFDPEERFACADVDLAWIDGLIDDASDVLVELLEVASNARASWPLTAETDELCAVLDAVKAVVRECGAQLGAVRTRAAQCRNDGLHLHVARGNVVRMVRADDALVHGSDAPDDDIPF